MRRRQNFLAKCAETLGNYARDFENFRVRFGPGDVSGVHLYAPKRRGTGRFSVSGERVEERGEEVKREQGESDWRRRRNVMMIQVERVKVCCCILFSCIERVRKREKRRAKI